MPQTLRHDLTPEDLRGLVYAQYVRDSTKDQAEGYGPEIQRRANKAFATRYGLLDSGLMYEEYVSGGSIRRRSQLLQALTDMQEGRYSVLLVGWTHRFARSTEDAARVKRDIMNAGGILVYTAQGMISGQRSSRVGEKVLHVLDEEYRDNLADLVANALRAKFDAGGANGVPPLGSKHVYVRRDGTIAAGPERQTQAIRVVDESTLSTLRAVLRHYVEAGSYRTTADWLNQQGYRTREGVSFTFSSVRDIIRNPFYGSEEIVRYHPGARDEELRPTPAGRRIFPDDIHDLWQQAQMKRHSWGARSIPLKARRVYPLHGVLRCENCDSVYHGQTHRGRRISRHADPDRGCLSPRTVQADLLEQQLAEALRQVTLPTDWATQIRDLIRRPPDGEQERERECLKRRLDRLRYQHLMEAIDNEMFAKEYRAIRAMLDRLPASSKPVVEAYQEPAALLVSIGQIVSHPSVQQRTDAAQQFRHFCDVAFHRIQIRARQLVTVEPRQPYAELFAIALAEKNPVRRSPDGVVGTGAVERT